MLVKCSLTMEQSLNDRKEKAMLKLSKTHCVEKVKQLERELRIVEIRITDIYDRMLNAKLGTKL